jgi:hypothetical protein
VYGWWFRGLPWPYIDITGCCHWQDRTLLYVGISPDRPPVCVLHASEKIVKAHVSSVLTKLGVQDRMQAAWPAVRHEPGSG